MSRNDSSAICLQCGLCCNGAIFARGQLQPSDDAERLQAVGVKLLPRRRGSALPKFAQPCAALCGCRCRIYSERPEYCRKFECALLRDVFDGRTDVEAAGRVIRSALRRVEKVKALLRKLGDSNEHVALSLRFRRVKKQMEKGIADEETADAFGELSLAVHDLNVLLSQRFYPGNTGQE